MSKLETVIGLEVHVHLNTQSKVFCACPANEQASANSNICPVCCGYPGVLPVLNKRALELALQVANALNCRINEKIYFERKNYFYPDLPKNYQISQYKLPLGEGGSLEIASGKKIGINRVHLEEDAGKLIHKDEYSLIDFNRTGTPLLEIVSEPDIGSPQEAYEYLRQLKVTIQYVGASECDMEKGSLRCDANISLRPKGTGELGTKTELKNMNSFRGVRDALSYEVKRQADMLLDGKSIIQETRLWNVDKQKTYPMRTKEEAHDYRYFPEPDLVTFTIREEMIRENAPSGELPLARSKRFVAEYGLSEKETDVLIADKVLADFFEQAVKSYPEPKKITNWLVGAFRELLHAQEGGWDEIKISPKNFSKIVQYFDEDALNNLGAKKVLSSAFTSNEDPDVIIERENLKQISAEDVLHDIIEEVVAANAQATDDYRKGKESAIMFLVGQVMKKTKGRSNPKIVKEMLERRIR